MALQTPILQFETTDIQQQNCSRTVLICIIAMTKMIINGQNSNKSASHDTRDTHSTGIMIIALQNILHFPFGN